MVDLIIICLESVILGPWNNVYVQMRDRLASLLSLVDADGTSVSLELGLDNFCKHSGGQANLKQL